MENPNETSDMEAFEMPMCGEDKVCMCEIRKRLESSGMDIDVANAVLTELASAQLKGSILVATGMISRADLKHGLKMVLLSSIVGPMQRFALAFTNPAHVREQNVDEMRVKFGIGRPS